MNWATVTESSRCPIVLFFQNKAIWVGDRVQGKRKRQLIAGFRDGFVLGTPVAKLAGDGDNDSLRNL